MIKNVKKSTSLAPQDGQTKSIHSAQSKPKVNTGLNKSGRTATRMLPSSVSITRRSRQKSSAGSQTAVVSKAERQSSKCESCDKMKNRSEDLESRIRSALSRNGSRRATSPSPSFKPSKSVKFDPAVIFCSDPNIAESSTTQERQFQTGLEAILKCKKSEREKLQRILDMLTKADLEDEKPDKENGSQSALNPRASIFQTDSSLKYLLPPKVVEGQPHASMPYAAPRRKLHPRPALDSSIFEPSEQVEKPKFIANQGIKNCQTPDLLENSNHLQGLFANVRQSPPNKTCVQKTFNGKVNGPLIPRRPSYESNDCQKFHLIDSFNDNGPGRVAVTMCPAWGQAILESFAQKYPMTGFLNPATPVLIQSQGTADVQQRLEFIIMQKKEMAALSSYLFLDGARTSAGC